MDDCEIAIEEEARISSRVVLFYEEYFCTDRRRILNFQRDEGERIVPLKSVQRDTGKISTLDKFPSFFNPSLLPACLPAERSEKG